MIQPQELRKITHSSNCTELITSLFKTISFAMQYRRINDFVLELYH